VGRRGSIIHISHLVVQNFRALEDIQFDLIPRANVIVVRSASN
jgi:recombinational DNA repair ATPase RecF